MGQSMSLSLSLAEHIVIKCSMVDMQASMPFDEAELEYVRRLEPKEDVELLRRELPALREESLRTLEVSTTLLKICCAAGLNLSEIATVISRPLVGIEEEPSELEKLCAQTRQEVSSFQTR